MKTRINLKWDSIDQQSREEILSGACLNSRFAYYEWCELEMWIQEIVLDSLKRRSHNTVTVG